MSATEIILSGIVFVLFLGIWDAHNRLDDLGKWQHACMPNPRLKKVKKAEQLEMIIEHKDTTISMLNKQIRDLKGDLTKCKHDYACEVARAKSSPEMTQKT